MQYICGGDFNVAISIGSIAAVNPRTVDQLRSRNGLSTWRPLFAKVCVCKADKSSGS